MGRPASEKAITIHILKELGVPTVTRPRNGEPNNIRGTVSADNWLMNLMSTRISRRRALLVALWLGYMPAAGGYLLLVAHKSGVSQTKRQQLIDESPAVWVAPYGIHYHNQNHYGRHLSAPLSLYEATERGYEWCDICHPPRPAQLVHPPVWVTHWLLILMATSCSLLILTLVTLYKTRSTNPPPLLEH